MIKMIVKKHLSMFGLAERRKVVMWRRFKVQVSIGSLFSEKAVVYGHCLVTFPLTVNQTIKWLTLLPSVMQDWFWWRQCSVGCSRLASPLSMTRGIELFFFSSVFFSSLVYRQNCYAQNGERGGLHRKYWLDGFTSFSFSVNSARPSTISTSELARQKQQNKTKPLLVVNSEEMKGKRSKCTTANITGLHPAWHEQRRKFRCHSYCLLF